MLNFAMSKENNNNLNRAATYKRRKIMTTYKNINEISDAEVLAILNQCMMEIFDEEHIAKKEAKKAERKAKRQAQREADFHECIKFCERVKAI